MAIEKSKILSWADIQALYSNLNTARNKFGIATVSIPSNPGKVKPLEISSLNDLVNTMSSNKYLKNVAVTGITVPSTGTLVYPFEFTKISQTITNINNTCAFDSFDACKGFDSFDSCKGFNSFDACNGFCPNNSCVSFNQTYFAGFRFFCSFHGDYVNEMNGTFNNRYRT